MATVQTIEVKALSTLMAKDQALCLVDVRTMAEFETVHAAGATPVPLTDLDPAKFMAAQGGSSKTIYLICKAGTRSRKAAEMFIGAGYANVVSVDGGTDAWVSAGLPVRKRGRNVLPLDRQVQTAAGLICLSGAVLGTWLNPWFYLLSGMVGFGLTVAGLTGFCPMGILLAKMPWNRGSACGSCCSTK